MTQTDQANKERIRLRHLIAGLYDADMNRRLQAAQKLGIFAKENPDAIKQSWGRIFYAFDDTMSCWGASEGLGEIARNLPDLRSKILQLLRKFQNDDVSCQGFVWAICRIGQVDRDGIREFIPDLINLLGSDTSCMLGQTIWTLGELGLTETEASIERHTGDTRETWIYENDTASKKSIGEISREALSKLRIKAPL